VAQPIEERGEDDERGHEDEHHPERGEEAEGADVGEIGGQQRGEADGCGQAGQQARDAHLLGGGSYGIAGVAGPHVVIGETMYQMHDVTGSDHQHDGDERGTEEGESVAGQG